MKGSLALAIWTLFLAAWWVVGWAIFDPDDIAIVIMGAGVGVSALMVGCAALREHAVGDHAGDEPTPAPDSSHATALAGIALVGMATATEFGPWLAYVSGGALVIALGGLVRETMAQREALHAVQEARRRAAPPSEGGPA